MCIPRGKIYVIYDSSIQQNGYITDVHNVFCRSLVLHCVMPHEMKTSLTINGMPLTFTWHIGAFVRHLMHQRARDKETARINESITYSLICNDSCKCLSCSRPRVLLYIDAGENLISVWNFYRRNRRLILCGSVVSWQVTRILVVKVPGSIPAVDQR